MQPLNSTEDFLLLERLREGDTKSFEVLFYRYWKPLYFVARNRLQDSEEAQEIVQDIFVDLWRRRAQLDIKTSLKTYLFAALRYAILDHIRGQKVREKYAQFVRESVDPFDNITAETVVCQELEHTIQQGMRRLPERCRQVFHLRRLKQYSVKEIAKQLNISPKTVENQLTKATKVLRLHLKEYVTVLLLFPCDTIIFFA